MQGRWLPRLAVTVSVLAIVGLICAMLATPIDSPAELRMQAQTRATLEIVGQSMDRWIAKNGRVPTLAEGLRVLELREDPVLDGWGHPIVFAPTPNGKDKPFTLRSRGADGIDSGGDGDDLVYPVR